jgi:hypothetical protein
MDTKYTFGRVLAGVMIILGWVVALALGVVVIINAKQNMVNAVLAISVGILIAAVAGALNHGAWQALIALFDMADDTHTASVNSGLQLEQLRTMSRSMARQGPAAVAPAVAPAEARPSEPTPLGSPLPPVQLPNGPRPGESSEQWAKRIEREEAEQFKARRR